MPKTNVDAAGFDALSNLDAVGRRTAAAAAHVEAERRRPNWTDRTANAIQGAPKSKPLPNDQKIVLNRIKTCQWDYIYSSN